MELRGRIKEILEKVRVANWKKVEEAEGHEAPVAPEYLQPLFMPEVVEYRREGNIQQKIMKALNRSHLYVGIFGNEYSQPTVDEFHEAVKRGMNTLVYYFTVPPSTLKEKAGTPSKPNQVHDFLMGQVKTANLTIRGNYKNLVIKTPSDLEDEIVADLSAEVMEMIYRYHNVQKAVAGFEV